MFVGRSRDTIRDELLAYLRAEYTANGRTLLTSRGSDAYLDASSLAVVLEGLEAQAEQNARDQPVDLRFQPDAKQPAASSVATPRKEVEVSSPQGAQYPRVSTAPSSARRIAVSTSIARPAASATANAPSRTWTQR